MGGGGILIKCDISSSMLEKSGRVFYLKLYKVVMSLVGSGW